MTESKTEFRFVKPGEVRVRFAPSPTGFLHLGLARTALVNYIFARKNEGKFILRIEDTDIERSKEVFEKDILEGLKWLGIKWDEGPDIGGNYGPYRQSQRRAIYKKYLEKLLKEGKAYYCFCSKEELEAERQYQMSIGQPPHYSGRCASLSKEEVKRRLSEGKPSVIRFRMPSRKVVFNDLIRGGVEFDTSLIGDIVIAKDLDNPLYNFSVVVDDFEMKISHVIRGEDHISNTPKQILIQEALGFSHPAYAHLPLILGPDRTKLSKRHGAVAIAEYRKEGYLPQALINFMAFLGWNPGTEREIYSLNSLIKDFSLDRIQKSGAVFNIKRLDFLNGFYIRQTPVEKLTELCIPYLVEEKLIEPVWNSEKLYVEGYKIVATGETISFNYLTKIVSIYRERLKKLSEIVELTDFFFKEKLDYEKQLLKWREMSEREIKYALARAEKQLSRIEEENWDREKLQEILVREAEKVAEKLKREGRGYLLWPVRVALTGKATSASPFEVAEVLGKEKTLRRLRQAIEMI
ncbi:glutamate--tRNA ligase [bacterium]|nr:glutamate--tRNA ligase [bacterium]